MTELLNIKDERDKAIKLAENAEKRLKENKKVGSWLLDLDIETEDQITHFREYRTAF